MEGLKKYTADNLLDFLSRQTDKELMKDFVVSLGGVMPVENEGDL